MRQTTLTATSGGLVRVAPRPRRAPPAPDADVPPATVAPVVGPAAAADDAVQALIDFLCAEEAVVFYAVIPFGNTLKCIAELLLRCANQTPMTVDAEQGVAFTACDQNSGRLIHIVLRPRDMLRFHVAKAPFRCTLETGSLFASFHPGGRRTDEANTIQNSILHVCDSYFFCCCVCCTADRTKKRRIGT